LSYRIAVLLFHNENFEFCSIENFKSKLTFAFLNTKQYDTFGFVFCYIA